METKLENLEHYLSKEYHEKRIIQTIASICNNIYILRSHNSSTLLLSLIKSEKKSFSKSIYNLKFGENENVLKEGKKNILNLPNEKIPQYCLHFNSEIDNKIHQLSTPITKILEPYHELLTSFQLMYFGLKIIDISDNLTPKIYTYDRQFIKMMELYIEEWKQELENLKSELDDFIHKNESIHEQGFNEFPLSHRIIMLYELGILDCLNPKFVQNGISATEIICSIYGITNEPNKETLRCALRDLNQDIYKKSTTKKILKQSAIIKVKKRLAAIGIITSKI